MTYAQSERPGPKVWLELDKACSWYKLGLSSPCFQCLNCVPLWRLGQLELVRSLFNHLILVMIFRVPSRKDLIKWQQSYGADPLQFCTSNLRFILTICVLGWNYSNTLFLSLKRLDSIRTYQYWTMLSPNDFQSWGTSIQCWYELHKSDWHNKARKRLN